MRKILVSAAALALPSVAAAHTSVVDHIHPHSDGHSYLGIDGLLLMAGVAVVAGVIVFALRKRLWSDR